MREIQNIDQTIGFMNETNAVEVTLQANQYRLDKLTQYQHFLAPGIRMLSGEIIEATEENIRVIASKTVAGPLVHHEPFHVNDQSMYDAIVAADELGKKYLQA